MQNKLLKVGVLSASLLSCVANAKPVDEIIVTAKGKQTLDNAFHTTHVFTTEDIELAQVNDIPDLLDNLVGVSVRDSGGRGSATSVFVRGAGNSQIIVLIDGVRVGSATLGAAALNSYPVEAIERIEVLKGPFSGIYGADAVGGVIQLFTKKGGKEGLGNVSLTVGSDSLVEAGVALQGGDDRNSFHIAAYAEETDGIDRTSILTGGNGDIDAFEETAVSFGGKMSFADHTVANLSVLYSDSTVEFDALFGDDPGLMTDTKTFSSALSINSSLAENVRWNNTLGINKDESITNGAFPSDLTTNRDSIGSEIVWDISETTLLTAGIDYYEEDIESPTTDFPISERDNKGAYAQLQTSAGKFGFVGSLRYDDNSAYGSNTNSSASISYGFNDNLRFIASYGTAFNAPSFNFLYFPFFGNPDIKPEESKEAEIGLIGNSDNFNWRISAYQRDVDDLHSFNPVTFLAANIGEAEIKGVEFEADTIVANWEVSLTIDLLSAEDKITGIELDDRAERTATLSASRNFGDLFLGFDLKAESNRFDLRGTELSSYALFDVRAAYQFNDQLSVLANIDNLFDKDYTVNLISATNRYNTAGTQAKLTIKYQF